MHFKMHPNKTFYFLIISISLTLAVEHKVTDQVFFDITIGNKEIGRMVIGLFGDIVPMTVKNFQVLATTGINGMNYTGTEFHRVIHKFIIQGGDILYNNGSGITSIYGYTFEDENFDVQHTAPGYVSMANSGPNSNGCQFFIITRANPWLDDKHVVFGKVISGAAIVHIIEHEKTDGDDRPLKPVVMTKSGTIPTPNPFFIEDDSYTFWAWLKAGFIPLSFSFAIMAFFHWVIRKLDSFRLAAEGHHLD